MCHSDLHKTTNEWADAKANSYPMVPGHEVLGIVNAIGAKGAPGNLFFAGAQLLLSWRVFGGKADPFRQFRFHYADGAVTKVSVGDRVGYGPQRNSCFSCESCHSHNEQVCLKFQGLYDPGRGGYATSITVRMCYRRSAPAARMLLFVCFMRA